MEEAPYQHFSTSFNSSEVDLGPFFRGTFAPSYFWDLFFFTLNLAVLRSLGSAVAGLIWYTWAGFREDANEEEKGLFRDLDENVFGESTFASLLVVNFCIWYFTVVGRLATNLLYHGPDETLEGIKHLDKERVVKNIFHPRRAKLIWWRMLFESFGLLIGWHGIYLLGQAYYGSEDHQNKKIKKRDADTHLHLNEDYLQELLSQRLNNIIESIEDS